MPSSKRFTEDSFRKEPWFRALCSAFLSCKSEEDIASLFRDVGTLGELQAWSERLEVAKQLANGLSYRQVSVKTGASTTTVTRVARFIENGAGGYRKVLKVHRHHRLRPAVRNMQQEKKIQQPPSSPKPTPLSPPSGTLRQGDTLLQKYLQKKDTAAKSPAPDTAA